MSPAKVLLTAWDWEPSVVLGCLALGAAYAAATRCRSIVRTLYFAGGLLLLLLDLVSPLDVLADEYLFSAHIVQHFLLGLAIPPLLILGIPRSLGEAALRRPLLRRMEGSLAAPPLAWSLGIGVMILWHIPALFNAALASEGLHIFEHLNLLAGGVIFWWPVLAPIKASRLPALSAVAYLFGACVCCSLLGAALAFAPLDLYPAYLHPEDPLGILPLFRTRWGLNPRTDRELGGMLMWVPGCFIYLTAILTTVAHWFGTPERYGAPEGSAGQGVRG
jgi:putative membrane protein